MAARKTKTQYRFGEAVRKERERQGITQAELAKRLVWSAGALSKLEKGEGSATPRFDTVAKIAVKLGVSLDDLAVRSGVLKRGQLVATRPPDGAAVSGEALRRAQRLLQKVAAEVGDAAARFEREAEEGDRRS